MKKKKLKKGNKGITLVALVVTIVVLLILAGISLNLVLGQNGIISRAQDARNQTAEGKANTEKSNKCINRRNGSICKKKTKAEVEIMVEIMEEHQPT